MAVHRKPRILPGHGGLPEKKKRVVKKPDKPAIKVVKKRVPFTMSPVQSAKMRQRMFDIDKYNSRQKSEWICEALDRLLNNPHWKSIVLGIFMAQRDPTDDHIAMMDDDLKTRLNAAYLELRTLISKGDAPKISDPMGAILRAAIMNRVNPIADSVSETLKLAKMRVSESLEGPSK